MKKTHIALALVLALILLLVYRSGRIGEEVKNLPYSQFLQWLDEGKITEANLSEREIRGTYRVVPGESLKRFVTVRVPDPQLTEKLRAKGVVFSGKLEGGLTDWLLTWIVPLFLMFLFWRWVLGRAGLGARGGFLPLGKSKAKVYVEKGLKTTFEDVAGVDEAKAEVQEVVSFLRDPTKYTRLGARIPKGILLVGPPGTGKTLLARAIAGEANVTFLSINGPEFVEMFVGVGAARVRDLFEQARRNAPCIIFIDELDALGKSRALFPLGSGANDEKEQTLNQLLAELDGFDSSTGVILLAATNRPEILDPALLRAGRFDRQILLDKPDQAGRAQILRVHVKKVKLAARVKIEDVAAMTPGFSGADLANLVNEAAIAATRQGREAIDSEDFTVALERIVAGLERKKRLMNAEEKRRVAYHEMGHATVSLAIDGMEKVHKVSIIPRGIGSLGYTLQRPTEDRYLMSRGELIDKMAVLLGGRGSEALHFDDISTGAGDDLVKASDIARAMVTQYGMSEKLGLVTFEKETSPFLKGAYSEPQRENFSEKTAEQIDLEVRALIDAAYAKAFDILKEHKDFVEAGAKGLLEKETLTEDEIQALWREFPHKTSTPSRKIS